VFGLIAFLMLFSGIATFWMDRQSASRTMFA